MPKDFEYSFRVIGMDCPSCASKIEKAAYSYKAITKAKVSTSSQILTVRGDTEFNLDELKNVINQLGYHLEAIDEGGEDSVTSKTHLTPAYKRTLLIVVLLNIGYGVIEMVGGFLSRSQALKADALDFLGDGLITLVGLFAIAWSLKWRARSALLQGIFLGVLGLSVLLATGYRVLVLEQPEAIMMGIYAAFALCVNIIAALILIPHRAGDSNVRAVWLFSRNDAIGNAMVILAALLVAWTKTPWPDLVVAIIIASLFLHSSYSIIKDAIKDLKPDK